MILEGVITQKVLGFATDRTITLGIIGTGVTINNITQEGGETLYYRHEQPVDATPWIVNHNLGAVPNISVYSLGGLKVEATVVNISENQAQVLLDLPFSGYAICS